MQSVQKVQTHKKSQKNSKLSKTRIYIQLTDEQFFEKSSNFSITSVWFPPKQWRVSRHHFEFHITSVNSIMREKIRSYAIT